LRWTQPKRLAADASGNLKAVAAQDVAACIACSNVFSESAICFATRVARCHPHVEPGTARKREASLKVKQVNFTALIKVF
jgi:hypothetical protein